MSRTMCEQSILAQLGSIEVSNRLTETYTAAMVLPSPTLMPG
jgi:hypothetical protein